MKKLWLDLETTGTDPNKHSAIQLAVIVETPKAEVVWEAKMRPWDGAIIEEEALVINGRTREEIMTWPEPKAVYAELLALLGDHADKFNRADKFWFWGFNSGFDFQFMHSLAGKCGDKYLMSWLQWPPLCVAQELARRFPDKWAAIRPRKLVNIAQAFGVEVPENLHDAKADILLTREIWRKACSNPSSWPQPSLN